jgi:hypothetical protein
MAVFERALRVWRPTLSEELTTWIAVFERVLRVLRCT